MHTLLSILLGATVTLETANWLVLAGDVLALATIPSVLLRRRGRPNAALSWILALLTLPYIGTLAWWILGRIRFKRHRERRRKATESLCQRCGPGPASPDQAGARLRAAVPFATTDRRWTDGVFPPARLDSARVLCDGEAAFPAMAQAIGAAQSEIRALFYIWKADATGRRFADLLASRARDGVRVRVMVDAVGGARFLRVCGPSLRSAGVEVARFLPARFRPWAPTFNFRNHRKLLVVDGERAFIGGMNIADEYAHTWHDLAFELTGPVVADLDAVFQEDWHFATQLDIGLSPAPAIMPTAGGATCVVIASGPDRDENRVHDAFFLGINQAQRRVWIATPYFVPSSAVLAALRGAAQRGLDVRLILPATNDLRLVQWASRSYYADLLRAGARVFEYQPRFSHTKAVVLDDDLTLVGSPNADVRSFLLNFELACLIDSPELNQQLTATLMFDLEQSVEVSAEDVADTPMGRRLVESAAHLLSPLL